MAETPEAFVALLMDKRSDWKPGYRFEQDVVMSPRSEPMSTPLLQIRTLMQHLQFPLVVEVVPGTEARHPDRIATLLLSRATLLPHKIGSKG